MSSQQSPLPPVGLAVSPLVYLAEEKYHTNEDVTKIPPLTVTMLQRCPTLTCSVMGAGFSSSSSPFCMRSLSTAVVSLELTTGMRSRRPALCVCLCECIHGA